VSLYDLTPIKGTHIVNINGIKYFINICIPGTKGIGGIMQVNNISYVSKKNLISKYYINIIN